jgi:hypothetical protein
MLVKERKGRQPGVGPKCQLRLDMQAGTSRTGIYESQALAWPGSTIQRLLYAQNQMRPVFVLAPRATGSKADSLDMSCAKDFTRSTYKGRDLASYASLTLWCYAFIVGQG